MFEFIRTHQRLMQFFLMLLIIPSFAFFGISGYDGFRNHGQVVAEVAGQSINQQDWDAAQKERLERYKQMLGAQFDSKMWDTPDMKRRVLDDLVVERTFIAEMIHSRLSMPDATLQQNIIRIPGLTTPDGKFDVEQYKRVLAAQGMTPNIYEEGLRQNLLIKEIREVIPSTAFTPKVVEVRISDARTQEREVQEFLLPIARYVNQVKVTDEMLKSYYSEHASQFEVPEYVKAEYVTLNSAVLANTQVVVSDKEAKDFYEQNPARYAGEEQRRASHILIKVNKNASAAEKATAQSRAEHLLIELRKAPSNFAKLAKEQSEDPGSAVQGGDLGFFGKGMMVMPFEKAAYTLKKGEISNVVSSDFGYHIIQLTEVKPASIQLFDAVKADIIEILKKPRITKKMAELSEQFSDAVYEQADSLKPVSEKLKLNVEVVEQITKLPKTNQGSSAPFYHPKFLQALFSDEVLKNKHNTEAIEIAPNTLIAGRVVEYKPATRRSFEEMKSVIKEQVINIEALRLAKKEGELKLMGLKSGDMNLEFGIKKNISYVKEIPVDSRAFPLIMKADVTRLPAFVGLEIPAVGYSIFKISAVAQPVTSDFTFNKEEQKKLSEILSGHEMLAYSEFLKLKNKAKISIK